MQVSHLDFTGYGGRRVHLGVTGSVAAYKALSLLRRVLATGASVGVSLTEAAAKFVTPLSFEALGADPVSGEIALGLEYVANGLRQESGKVEWSKIEDNVIDDMAQRIYLWHVSLYRDRGLA